MLLNPCFIFFCPTHLITTWGWNTKKIFTKLWQTKQYCLYSRHNVSLPFSGSVLGIVSWEYVQSIWKSQHKSINFTLNYQYQRLISVNHYWKLLCTKASKHKRKFKPKSIVNPNESLSVYEVWFLKKLYRTHQLAWHSHHMYIYI